jgi:hypothetical protein
MNAVRRHLFQAAFLVLPLFGASPIVFADDSTGATEAAVWTRHVYSFQYMGFTSTYSCDGLADKLRQLLVAAGARADAKASPGACASTFGRPDKLARAELTFYTLAPAASAPAGAEGSAAGAWKPVAFGNSKPLWLQNGDCELVDQFRREVLPMFATRNVDSRMTCVPHQESGSSIRLQFEALVEVPGAVAAIPAPTVFAYPKLGQSAAQQATDRSECAAAAAKQSGYDPAHPGTDSNVVAAYELAQGACLAARGYSVK